MTKKLADAGERRKIVEELDKTFFVEAGAGSGKTKSLVDRMIALLKAGKCGISEIAAVTFTRKAAAELRGRFQIELEQAVADARLDQGVRERLAAALQNLEQCYIGTIHSFCAKLLRERPVEIGLDPDFAEMEELEADVFREQSWLEYLVRVRLEESDVLSRLDEVGLAPEDLKGAFDAVALYPEVAVVGGREDIPDYARFRAALEKFLERARRAVPRVRPEKGYDGLQRLMFRCFNRQRNLKLEDHRVLMETFEIQDKDPKVTFNRWSTKEEAEAFQAQFDKFREEVVGPALKAWRECRHDRIVRFLGPAIAFFEARRKEENKLDYEDLLLHAARLLRDNPEVRRYFSRKFTHVLVDEFQDTDPIQAEVLMYLKGTDVEEKDWQKLRPAPGSLFLVGDPKQSIYRFRRADIDIYNLVKKIVKDGGGVVLQLTTNFRSLGALAEWNNPLWKAVLPQQSDRYQAAFAPLETVREGEEGCASGVYKIVAPRVPRHKGEDIARFDAESIADWIRWACAGNLTLNSGDTTPDSRNSTHKVEGSLSGNGGRKAQPSDFLVLFRYKKHMHIYARALEARGIPFEITGSAAFAEAEEIGEIRNLALALNDPDNPVYTVAVLRGVFFGASDEDLVEFKREGGRFNFATPGKDILESKKLGATVVSMALAKLREWRKWTLELPPSAALQKIFEDSGILNFYVSLEMGSSRVGNVLKLLEIVRNEERKGVTAFAQTVKFLEELSEVRDIEEMSLTPARENAVRLMNLHKAKGLEAPIVFLADPVGIREHEVEKHIIRVRGEPGSARKAGRGVSSGAGRGWSGPLGYFVFKEPKKSGKTDYYTRKVLSRPVGWETAAEEEKKYETAEETRLMYVAATRARDMLVISTYAGEPRNKAWEILDGALSGVPELEAAGGGEGAETREKVLISKAEVARARKEIAESLKAAAEPTYDVQSVTALARKEYREGVGGGVVSFRKRVPGFGLSWGRVVHQVLEAVGSGRLKPKKKELELFVENVMTAEESDFSDKEMLLTHIEAILGSPFWARVMRAEKRYFEIPFSIRTSERELAELGGQKSPRQSRGKSGAGRGSDLSVILSGTIDLVFWEDGKDSEGRGGAGREEDCGEEHDARAVKNGQAGQRGEDGKDARDGQDGREGQAPGWVIVDYKTDRIPISEAALASIGQKPGIERIRAVSPEFASIIDFYAPQIGLYTRFWSQVTGEPVRESGLYFTSIDRWVSLGV